MQEQSLSRIHRRNSTRNDLQSTYIKLNQFMESLNDKITSRIQLVAQVYLQDYKTQIKEMTQELKSIRTVLDQQLLKQRANERLFFLEEERDFFRSQVMKLNEEMTSINRNSGKLKEQLQEAKAEASNYKSIVAGLQRKIIKIQNQAVQNDKIKETALPSSKSLQMVENKDMMTTQAYTRPNFSKFMPIQSNNLRKGYQSVELRRNQSQHRLDGQLKRKQQILQDCIRDVKKKIFYRTLNNGQERKFHFEEDKKVAFNKFTRTDKQDLIRSVLSQPSLLEQFYDFMTIEKDPKTTITSTPQRFTKTLGHKSSFTDKIFKIKLCGIKRELK